MASSNRNSTDAERVQPERPPLSSSPHFLHKAVLARRADYVRPRKIKIKIGSWNVGACPGTDKDLAGWFVDGKGIDKRLAGLKIATENTHSQDHVESVGHQENRHTTKESTIPRGDEGIIAGGDEVGLYVLGLQEVVQLRAAKEYIGRIYSDTGPTTKWRTALTDALPPGYQMIVEQQLSGLLLYIFASPSVAPTISSVSTVSVGTGILGYLGNKGAVTTRLILGETTRMVFVNSHLASGNDASHLERRCSDVTQILQRTHFEPINWGGVLDDGNEGIGDEDFAFWFGDLNFRLNGLPGDDIRRLLMLHTRGEYELGQKSRNKIDGELGLDDSPIIIHSVDSEDDDSEDDSLARTSGSYDPGDGDSSTTLPDPDDFIQDPSQDPASLQATIDSLLPHDQLRHVQKRKKAFHDGWREGSITFLPTYKYDVGSVGMFDSSEKGRAPSWCDRILFRTRKDKLEHEGKRQDELLAKIKDDQMKLRGMDHVVDDEDVLFDYDPEDEMNDTDGAPVESMTTGKDFYDEYDEGEDAHPEELVTAEGAIDKLALEVYTSHQRVLSSDHKPLDAVFTLEYDAVVPELKSKVQQEVARELDRAENEGRPGITVVVDRSQEVENVNTGGDARQESDSASQGINLGPISFQKRTARTLTVANTSQVTSTVAFVERPREFGEGDQIAPPWLTASFVEADEEAGTADSTKIKREITLEPGEAVNCTLEVFVDDISLVRSLNENKTKLDDVLVLRVTDGRDHFVPVGGEWLQSCFGRSIDELIRVPEGGVRALLPPRKGEQGGPVNRGQEVRWSAPRELFKLTEEVETLADRVTAEASILFASQVPKEAAGWPFDPKSWLLKDTKTREDLKSCVLEALDSDKNLNNSFPPEIPSMERLEIVAEVLMLWLGSLTDGVVTEPLWASLDADITARGTKQITDAEESKAWVLEVLSASPNHNISFVFLTSMLNRVADELAPLPKSGWRGFIGHKAKGSFDSVRRSLSWKGKPPQVLDEDVAVITKRQDVEKAYASLFATVVFRGPSMMKDRERRIMEERRRYVMESFLQGSHAGVK